MSAIVQIILGITIVATALIAGLFYAWSCGIVQGLGKLSNLSYLQAMQSINREIQRPLFLVLFVGNLVLLPLTTWLCAGAVQTSALALLIIASVFYVVGVFGVTIAGNVPLNNMLDRVQPGSSSPGSLAETRFNFEARWNRLNRIRTVCALAALLGTIAAALYK